MRDRIDWRSVSRAALTALVLAAGGCATSDPNPQPEPGGATPDGEGDPVGAAIANLGAMVTGCMSSASSTTLTLDLATEPAVVSAPNGKLTVNGNTCTVMGTGATMTTSTVTKIVVNGTTMNDKVIFDLLPGTFGAKILSSTGGITVDFKTNDGMTDTDTVMIRGSSAPETFKFATSTDPTADIFVDLTGDKTADIKITPGTLAVVLTASMGAGADTIIANPVLADMNGFAGTNNIMTTVLQTDLIAYGGIGADKFTGGAGDDTFYGGADDDTFKMAATTDGADTYIGDGGSDTVDYSNRMAAVSVDVGPSQPTAFGNVDLGAAPALFGAMGTLDMTNLVINADAAMTDVTVTFNAPAGPTAVVTQINAACTTSCAAYLTGKNHLAITTKAAGMTPSLEIKADPMMMGADTALGLTQAMVTSVADADDGLAGEMDDVRASVENITGGTGNDTLIGGPTKNTIKGGNGDDVIEGGANNCMMIPASDGDLLQGEAGNDTIYMPYPNCMAVLAGGAGNDTADFSGRSIENALSNDAASNDGDVVLAEKANIGNDIEAIVGGYGIDTITGGVNNDTFTGGAGNDFLIGGAGDDTFIAGAGADTYNGGLGFDTLTYASYTMGITATLCVTTATTVMQIDTACGMRDDGMSMESDQIANVEHVIGGTGNDTMTASTVAATFEGGDGMDTLTGGPGDDILWGDNQVDTLVGGAGDDMLDGGSGADNIDGGAGDGDVCVTDAADASRVMCELG